MIPETRARERERERERVRAVSAGCRDWWMGCRQLKHQADPADTYRALASPGDSLPRKASFRDMGTGVLLAAATRSALARRAIPRSRRDAGAV